jgi:hypothetical protein
MGFSKHYFDRLKLRPAATGTITNIFLKVSCARKRKAIVTVFWGRIQIYLASSIGMA